MDDINVKVKVKTKLIYEIWQRGPDGWKLVAYTEDSDKAESFGTIPKSAPLAKAS